MPLAIGIFHYVIDSFALRTLTVALFQGSVFIAIALTLLTSPQAERWRYPYVFTAAMAAVVASVHLARGVIFMLAANVPSSLLQPSPWNLFFLSASTLVMPVMTLGAIMMVHATLMAKSEHAANRDYLTGAWSRRAFFQHAQRELKRAANHGSGLALLLIDADHFKEINDCFGHAAGDRVLVDIVRKGQALLRNTDRLGRIGGEEFAVLLTQVDRRAALAFAERLRATLQTQPAAELCENQVAPYTVSIGVATLQAAESFPALMRRADAALYQAKAAGRNRVMSEPETAPPATAASTAI